MTADTDLQLTELSCDAGSHGVFALRAVLCVPGSHAILPGHFPGAPLVPGVLLLEAVRRACERSLAERLTIAEVVQVRFTQPVAPAVSVVLTARLGVVDAQVDVDGEWRSDAGGIATFRLRLVRNQA